MQNSHGKRSQKIWTEIVFSKRSRKNNLQPFSWGSDNPLLTLEMLLRIFPSLVSSPSQTSLVLPAKSRCQSPHFASVPSATSECHRSRLRGVAKLLGSAPGSNNSSGNLFAPSVPLQVAQSNGAKTQQTKVQSAEAQNRNKTAPTVTTELRKSCTGLIACRAKKGTIFVPGAAEFAYESLCVYQAFSLHEQVNKHH